LSYNSYYALSVEKAILKVINESQIELKPNEIVKLLKEKGINAKASTVRVLLRKLLARGLIVQPYSGAYCSKITYGVRFVPLAVHNVRLHSNLCRDVEHWEIDEFVGGVKIHVCFGSERRKVSGFIGCDGGMSKDACFLALHRWFDVVEGRLGFGLRDVVVTSFELNRDFAGLRLDGVKCVTVKGLFGVIERIYQKEENVVRFEHKVSKPMSVNAFEAFFSSGAGGFDSKQALYELKREVASQDKTLKFLNQRVLELGRLQEAMYRRMLRGSSND
jgi:hypothetical protein